MRSSAIGAGLGIAVIAFGAAFQVTKMHLHASVQTEYLGRTQWVPFVADIRSTEHGLETYARHYQNSRGSTRIEGFGPDKVERAITIHNLDLKVHYFGSPVGTWAMLPMDRIRDKPPRMKTNTRGLSTSPDAPRLGYTVFSYVTRSGQRSLLAPDLNLFRMLVEDLGGSKEEVTKVERGEQPDELFLPPKGVQLRQAKDVKDLTRIPKKG